MRILFLFLFLASSTAFANNPSQDVMMRDCIGDAGNSPSGCPSMPYVSPDVWVRTQQDGIIFQYDDTPVSNNPAYVYIRLKNIGSTASCCGTLHLYFRDASAGGSTWPTHWINFWQGGSLRGDEIGTLNVCSIPAGQEQIVTIMWPSVPDNQVTGSHHCLLARWVDACDPMQVTEGPYTMTNVVNNNNVVHHNCLNTKKGDPPKPVSVFNASSAPVRTALVFDARKDKNGRTLFDIPGMRVKIHLGELWGQWEDHSGENLDEVIDDEQAVIISNEHAVIDGIELPAAQGDEYTNFVVTMEVLYPDDIAEEEQGNVYRLTMEQHDDGVAEDLVDGVAFDIHISNADVMMRDCISDNGSSPSGCGGAAYVSPDIWLRLQPDGLTNQYDDAPVSYQPAYVYIRLKNIGNAHSCCGTLHLYFSDAGTGVSTWPTHWVNFQPGGILRGDEIGTVNVCSIPPGQEQIVTIMWPSVPENSNAGSWAHHCLLARWEDACDLMQVAEIPSTITNVLNNNNIAHHNCMPTRKGTPPQPVVVFNARPEPVRSTLVFDAHENEEDGRTIFDIEGMRVKVILNDELWARWEGDGENIEVIESEHAVIITNPHATIDGLELPEGTAEEYTTFAVNVEVEYPDDILSEDRGKIYRWTMEQHDEDYDEFDGMAFDIHMTDEDDAGGKRVVPANILGETLKLNARPNISTGSSVISYSLPTETRITLAIYDAGGNLVRTLVANEMQTIGGHEVNWNGTGANGVQVASGTYFYRIVTPEGTAEKQIKIVR